MHEQKAFVQRLAQMAAGVSVYIMDVRVGLVHKDFGEMLEDYNEECNRYPEVNFERAFKNTHGQFLADHGTASMLGIFGNLMTCTSAHGAVMTQVVQGEDEINIAGDDGAFAEDWSNEDAADICICALGEYEKTKTFDSREEGCICLKRPLWVELGTIHAGITCIPPNLALIEYLLFKRIDSRYTFTTDNNNQTLCLNIVGKDLMRFLRSVHRAAHSLDDDQLNHSIATYVGITHKFQINPTGGLPPCGDPFFWPVSPTIEGLRGEDPLRTLVSARYRGFVEYPVRDIQPRDRSIGDFVVGDSFQCNSDRHLALLVKLGILEVGKVLRIGDGLFGYERLVDMFTRPDVPYVCEFSVKRTVPPLLSSY
jgi:hypothetical protein